MNFSKQITTTLLVLALLLPPVSLFAGGDAARGKRIYQQYCTPCHGQNGRGRGPRASNEALQPPPRNHTDGFYMNRQTDVRLFKVIRNGGKANNLSHIMPQWKHILKDKQVFSLVAFIRTLATDPEYIAPKAKNWDKNPYAGDERYNLKESLNKK